MPSPLSKLACAGLLVLGAAALPEGARAEPPGLRGAEHHAVGPLPKTYSSPMPSLPPPQHLAPGERPEEERGASAPGPHVIRRPGFRAYVAADGSIHFGGDSEGGGAYADPVRGTGATFHFGLTDAVTRWLGEDPYLAEKLALMDSTRAGRARMRAEHDAETMERALADLPRYLHAVWGNSAWSAKTRRRLLFLLWDEAAERGSAQMRDGGARARRAISRFIARNLPPGSPDAYSREELAALNRIRSSGRPFEPYAGDRARRARPMIAAAGGLERLLRAF